MEALRETCVSPTTRQLLAVSRTIDSTAVLVALARDGFRGRVAPCAIPGLVSLAATEGMTGMLNHVRDDTGLTVLSNGWCAWMFESFYRPCYRTPVLP